MAYPFNRIKASLVRRPDLESDKEAWAILALNDAAARSRQGRFYYLPESREPFKIPRAQHEPVVMNSLVPRLLHADHVWKEDEIKEYRKLDDKARYDYVQETTSVVLENKQVLPINLVIHTTGMTSLCWPAESLATVVIYGHVYGGDCTNPTCYRLSKMSDWIGKATKNGAGDKKNGTGDKKDDAGDRENDAGDKKNGAGNTYTVPMLQRKDDKFRFRLTGNSLGKARGPEEIPSSLSLLLKTESQDCFRVAGSEVLERLALEAKRVNGGEVSGAIEVLKDGGKGLSGAISGMKIKVES